MKRRRLPRILVNAATAVSLVLCVATAVLWARSYRVADDLDWRVPTAQGSTSHALSFRSVGGRVVISAVWEEGQQLSRGAWAYEALSVDRQAPPRWWPFLGFQYSGTRFGTPAWASQRILHVPYWASCAALAALPLLRSARCGCRRVAGRCPACGYDLRATPERCPECGAAAASGATPPA